MVAKRPRAGVLVSFLTALVVAGTASASATGSGNFKWLDCSLASGAGSPSISATGALRPGGSISVTVDAAPGEACALLVGSEASVPGVSVPGGQVVPSGITTWLAMPLNGFGKGSQTFFLSEVPSAVYVQAVTVDVQGNFHLSNTVGSNRGHQWVVDPAPVTWGERQQHDVAVLNDRLYLVGGEENFERKNDVHRFNGSKWTRLLAHQPSASNRFSPRTEHAMAALGGRLWVGFGETSAGEVNDLWSSPDGVNWTRVTADASKQGGPGPRRNATLTAFGGKLWVTGGYYRVSQTQAPTTLFLRDVYSYDIQTGVWTKHPTPPWQGREEHVVLRHRGRLYLVGGLSVANNAVPFNYELFSDTWSTQDGNTWRLETSNAGFEPMRDHTVVSFDGELRLTGGYLNTFNYQWRSLDGRNWSVPLELGGPGYSFGNQPIASAAKAAMPDIVRYDSVSAVLKGRLYSLGGYKVGSGVYDTVLVTD